MNHKYKIDEILSITMYYKDENGQEIKHTLFDKEQDGPFDQSGISVTLNEENGYILDIKEEKEKDERHL